MADILPAVDTKTVTSAGTPEALTTRDVQCTAVIITARTGNSGVIYIVDATTTSKKWPADGLTAGQSATINTNNPASIQIDTDSNGDGVSWIAQ